MFTKLHLAAAEIEYHLVASPVHYHHAWGSSPQHDKPCEFAFDLKTGKNVEACDSELADQPIHYLLHAGDGVDCLKIPAAKT